MMALLTGKRPRPRPLSCLPAGGRWRSISWRCRSSSAGSPAA